MGVTASGGMAIALKAVINARRAWKTGARSACAQSVRIAGRRAATWGQTTVR
jgi:hypothetical protein